MVVESSWLDPDLSSQRKGGRKDGERDTPFKSFTWPTTGLRSDSSRASMLEVCGVESSRGDEDAVGMSNVAGRICRVTDEFQTDGADV